MSVGSVIFVYTFMERSGVLYYVYAIVLTCYPLSKVVQYDIFMKMADTLSKIVYRRVLCFT